MNIKTITIKNNKEKIPDEIKKITDKLIKAGFQAYLVGGCVRDLLLKRKPKDWDITTNAKPEEIQKIFPESIYENTFGTVGIKTDSQDSTLKVIEITTFRREEKYSDLRHPDKIEFAKTIEEDLARRDFTVNAMAVKCDTNTRMHTNDTNINLVDPFNGQADLKNKLIRAVDDPDKRFSEDALRLMRAVRFAAELDFKIETKTAEAILKNAEKLSAISKERGRDELQKILLTERAAQAIQQLQELKLLENIIPELQEGIGVTQNKHHTFTVWDHNLRSLDYAAKKNYSLEIRLASLLHDVAKPRAKRGEGPDSTFYGHEVIGARMTLKILERLRFSKKIIEKVVKLVRCHLFYYDTEEVTDSSVRRLIQRVGPENIYDLVKVREADRIGSGVPKAVPYRLRHFLYRVEKVMKEPAVSLRHLQIGGNEVMEILRIPPGPKVGMILNAIFEEVLDDPKKNEKEYLLKRVKELGKLSEKELKKLAEAAKEKYRHLLEEEEEEMKKRYYVR